MKFSKNDFENIVNMKIQVKDLIPAQRTQNECDFKDKSNLVYQLTSSTI